MQKVKSGHQVTIRCRAYAHSESLSMCKEYNRKRLQVILQPSLRANCPLTFAKDEADWRVA